ncbi:MAG TPA: hypothetical protein VGP64_03935 [Polyangia bacterium]|jgi:hypothetical protein
MSERALRRPHFPEALFEESWRSVRRGIVHANLIVWVSLLPDRLVTGVHLPFNVLLFPRRLYRWLGAEVDIPLPDIVSMENETFLLQQWLRITYRTPTGEASFGLHLHRPDALRQAFIAARQRS